MLCKIIFCGAILSTSILRRQNVKSLVFLIYIFTPPIICSFLISLLASGTRVHTRLFAIVQVTDKNTLVQGSSFHLFPVNLFGMVIRTYCLRHEKYALKNVAYLCLKTQTNAIASTSLLSSLTPAQHQKDPVNFIPTKTVKPTNGERGLNHEGNSCIFCAI